MSQTQSTTHSARHGTSPLLLILVGIACIAFWVLASLLQIQTSEAYLLHGQTVAFTPNWAILSQPVDFFQGKLTPDVAKSVLWGWGVELMFLVCIVGYEVAHESIKASSHRLSPFFQTGMIALIAFDAWADFQYGTLGSGFWGQVAFAGITAFIVMFFGIVGLRLIEHGIGSLRA